MRRKKRPRRDENVAYLHAGFSTGDCEDSDGRGRTEVLQRVRGPVLLIGASIGTSCGKTPREAAQFVLIETPHSLLPQALPISKGNGCLQELYPLLMRWITI